MSIPKQKEAVREKMKKAGEIFAPAFAGVDDKIVKHLLALPEYRAAGSIFTFLPSGGEPDIMPAVRQALQGGKVVAVPRCKTGSVMDAVVIRGLSALVPGAFGILEPGPDCREILSPEEIELILMPGVAFSRSDGVRLGRGGGYYDRFCEGYRGRLVGIAREYMVLNALPHEPHDAKANALVTEKGIIRIG